MILRPMTERIRIMVLCFLYKHQKWCSVSGINSTVGTYRPATSMISVTISIFIFWDNVNCYVIFARLHQTLTRIPNEIYPEQKTLQHCDPIAVMQCNLTAQVTIESESQCWKHSSSRFCYNHFSSNIMKFLPEKQILYFTLKIRLFDGPTIRSVGGVRPSSMQLLNKPWHYLNRWFLHP